MEVSVAGTGLVRRGGGRGTGSEKFRGLFRGLCSHPVVCLKDMATFMAAA